MKHLILVLFLSLGYSQFVPSHRAMMDKIAFLEEQAGVIVEPEYQNKALSSLDSLKNEADKLYYIAYRAEVVGLISDIIAEVKGWKYTDAISGIDYLIANQEKYFYKGRNLAKRLKTIARYESIQTKLGAI